MLPPTVVDLGIASALGAIALIQVTVGDRPDVPFSREADGWLAVLILLQVAPLVLRRRFPILVLAAVTAAFMVDQVIDYPDHSAVLAVPVSMYSLGAYRERRTSTAVGAAAAVIVIGFSTVGVLVDSLDIGGLLGFAIFIVAPWLLGQEVRERRSYQAWLEERAAWLERDREDQAKRAVREERARIARELHDVVAHEVSVMTVQAAGARRVLAEHPESAAAALEAIEESGRQALAEMRILLGVLRPEGEEALRTPQPGLARLDGLVEQVVGAGLPVSVAIGGEPRPLPAGVDVSAYRIVQEALTNSLKHAGPRASARVHIDFGVSDLGIEVVDDGRGSASELADGNGAGLGLVGMRERAAMLGGDLRAGPLHGGGYRVRATLPLSTS